MVLRQARNLWERSLPSSSLGTSYSIIFFLSNPTGFLFHCFLSSLQLELERTKFILLPCRTTQRELEVWHNGTAAGLKPVGEIPSQFESGHLLPSFFWNSVIHSIFLFAHYCLRCNGILVFQNYHFLKGGWTDTEVWHNWLLRQVGNLWERSLPSSSLGTSYSFLCHIAQLFFLYQILNYLFSSSAVELPSFSRSDNISFLSHHLLVG